MCGWHNKFPIVTLIKDLCVPWAHLRAPVCVYHKHADINWHASLAQVLKCLRLQVCNTFDVCCLVLSAGRAITLAFLSSRFGLELFHIDFTGQLSVWVCQCVCVCVCVFLSLSFNDCLGFALSLPTRCRFHFQFSLSLLFSTQRESRISLPPLLSL